MVKRFKDMENSSFSKEARIKRIATDTRFLEKEINSIDNTVNSIYKAFSDPKRSFEEKEVKKIILSLGKASRLVGKYLNDSYKRIKFAVANDIPNDKIASQVEDLGSLKSKIALMRAQAASSIGLVDEEYDEDLVELDETGYVVDEDEESVVDEMVEEEPMVDEEAMTDDEMITGEEELEEELEEPIEEPIEEIVEEPIEDIEEPVEEVLVEEEEIEEEATIETASDEAGEVACKDEKSSEETASDEDAQQQATSEETASEEEATSEETASEEEATSDVEADIEVAQEDIEEEEDVPLADELEFEDQGIDDVVSQEVLGEDEFEPIDDITIDEGETAEFEVIINDDDNDEITLTVQRSTRLRVVHTTFYYSQVGQ